MKYKSMRNDFIDKVLRADKIWRFRKIARADYWAHDEAYICCQKFLKAESYYPKYGANPGLCLEGDNLVVIAVLPTCLCISPDLKLVALVAGKREKKFR